MAHTKKAWDSIVKSNEPYIQMFLDAGYILSYHWRGTPLSASEAASHLKEPNTTLYAVVPGGHCVFLVDTKKPLSRMRDTLREQKGIVFCNTSTGLQVHAETGPPDLFLREAVEDMLGTLLDPRERPLASEGATIKITGPDHFVYQGGPFDLVNESSLHEEPF